MSCFVCSVESVASTLHGAFLFAHNCACVVLDPQCVVQLGGFELLVYFELVLDIEELLKNDGLVPFSNLIVLFQGGVQLLVESHNFLLVLVLQVVELNPDFLLTVTKELFELFVLESGNFLLNAPRFGVTDIHQLVRIRLTFFVWTSGTLVCAYSANLQKV